MPNRDPIALPDTPRGPQNTPGLPERGQEQSPVPPVINIEDTKNPNDPSVLDPALLPIGDPAGMA